MLADYMPVESVSVGMLQGFVAAITIIASSLRTFRARNYKTRLS